jgi:hypothetical protein
MSPKNGTKRSVLIEALALVALMLCIGGLIAMGLAASTQKYATAF